MKPTQSIMQRDPYRCYLCGEPANYIDGNLEGHHVFFGTANRKKSEEFGLKVSLHAYKCHRLGPRSVHKCKEMDIKLKQDGQRAFELAFGDREDFRNNFGKSYL